MESEFAHCARIGERREEADAGLRGVYSSGPRKESCLSKSLKFPSLTEKTAPSGLGRACLRRQAKACPYNFAYAAVGLLGLVILFGGVGCKQQKQPAPDVWASVNGQDIKRSEEHTSELQSLRHLVCRLLLEKKKRQQTHLPLTDQYLSLSDP